MQKINSVISLKEAILELEGKQEVEKIMLREQFHATYESLKPINLIKSAFKEVSESEDLKDELVNTSIGLAVGYISKKIFEGVSSNPIRKLLGTALMFGIKSVIAKNPEAVKSMIHGLMNIIRNKLDNVNETENTKADFYETN